jgi:hypothetical protein
MPHYHDVEPSSCRHSIRCKRRSDPAIKNGNDAPRLVAVLKLTRVIRNGHRPSARIFDLDLHAGNITGSIALCYNAWPAC